MLGAVLAKYDPTSLRSKYPHLADDKFIPRLIEFRRTELSSVSSHRSLKTLGSFQACQLPPWFQYHNECNDSLKIEICY